MELLGVLLIGAGVVAVLAALGVVKVGGPKGLDVNALLERRQKANEGYPASGFSVSDAYGNSYSETIPLHPMHAERYGGMDAEAMAEELHRRGGQGPGPNHPG